MAKMLSIFNAISYNSKHTNGVNAMYRSHSAFPYDLGSKGFCTGLSKREMFAAMVLQGFASRPIGGDETVYERAERLSKEALSYADALIDALDTEPKD